MRPVLVVLPVMWLAACTSVVPVFNQLISHEGYSIRRDVAYGSDPRQKMDIYTPDHLTQKAPVILFIYGGSWQWGDKQTYLFVGETFARQGFVVAVADYRLYPQVRYPDFLKDCASAFAYVHAHIADYGGDPDRVFLAGHSAGAYNAVMLASDTHYLKDAGADISQVRGVIGMSGPYDFLPLTDPDLIQVFGGASRPETQPINYIDGKRPPMLLATGDADETVSPGNDVRMAAKLRSYGNTVETPVYHGIGHIGIIFSLVPGFRGNTTLREDVVKFVNSH